MKERTPRGGVATRGFCSGKEGGQQGGRGTQDASENIHSHCQNVETAPAFTLPSSERWTVLETKGREVKETL